MKAKEAIYYLTTIEDKYIHGGDEYYDEQRKMALHLAMDALYKQMPKKPIKLVSKLLLGAGWTYKCPTCGCACGENKYHLEVTQDDIYCTQCGQMLDWD